MIDQPQTAPKVTESLRIGSGLCHVMFAYDAARSIDLDAAERRIHESSERQTLRHKRRAPSYLEYRPPPLRITHNCAPLDIGTVSTRANVDLPVYDFGAVAVTYCIALGPPFDALLSLSERLYDNARLLSDSRKSMKCSSRSETRRHSRKWHR